MKLANYLRRIAVAEAPKADLATLAMIIASHSRAIAFENFDVVQRKPISMAPADVRRSSSMKGAAAIVGSRTSCCTWRSQKSASVKPLMCRVRWGKSDDSAAPNTTFTHMALNVATEKGLYLADVGSAGTNSMAPVALGVGAEPQALPEGTYQVVPSKHESFHVLELQIKGEWRPLYEWRDEKAPFVDMECANFFSYAYPKARFTTQFFCTRIIGDERHHILNGDYVVRKGHGVESTVTTTKVESKAQLLALIDEVFGGVEGIDRYTCEG